MQAFPTDNDPVESEGVVADFTGPGGCDYGSQAADQLAYEALHDSPIIMMQNIEETDSAFATPDLPDEIEYQFH